MNETVNLLTYNVTLPPSVRPQTLEISSRGKDGYIYADIAMVPDPDNKDNFWMSRGFPCELKLDVASLDDYKEGMIVPPEP